MVMPVVINAWVGRDEYDTIRLYIKAGKGRLPCKVTMGKCYSNPERAMLYLRALESATVSVA